MSKESLADSNLQETPVSNMLEPASKSIWKPIIIITAQKQESIVIMLGEVQKQNWYIDSY